MHTFEPRPTRTPALAWALAVLVMMGLLGCAGTRADRTPLPVTLRSLPTHTASHQASSTPTVTMTASRPAPTATATPLSASLPIIGGAGLPTATSTAASAAVPMAPIGFGTAELLVQAPAPDDSSATPAPSPTSDPCAHLVRREGDHLTLYGERFVFAGVNAVSLMDESLPEAELPAILDTLQSWGVTMVRIWVRPGRDLQRFEYLLDLAQPRGIRYLVTLQDYYHWKDVRWFETQYLTEDLPHIETVVTRFGDRPEIAIWEVMNEPWCGAPGEVTDPNCYRSLQAWAEHTTQLIRRLDPCRPISLGTLGARHLEIEQQAYRDLSAIDTVDILSMHRVPGDWYNDPVELDIARELNKPIMLGEVTVLGYSMSCEQLGPLVVPERARLLETDINKALELGMSGYLLWDYAPGSLLDVYGKVRHYCSVYGYFADDPVGPVICALDIPRVPIPTDDDPR